VIRRVLPAGGSPRPRLAIEQVRTRLRDGTRVVVRPVRPEDKELLLDGFSRLSEASRFRRFMSPVTELSDEQLRYLTEVDYFDHFAWAAVLGDRPDVGIGVGRYIRIADEPDVAEVAITVVDEHQGKGLGTLLLGMLAATARLAGIGMFRAFVLEDNTAMRTLLEDLGVRARHDAPGVLAMDVPLDPERLPDSPAGLALKAVAASVLPVKSRVEL
jgi:RimJ/RimL family protein N-acetyltransferase